MIYAHFISNSHGFFFTRKSLIKFREKKITKISVQKIVLKANPASLARSVPSRKRKEKKRKGKKERKKRKGRKRKERKRERRKERKG